MKDPKESLGELLIKVEKAELHSVKEKLQAILECADIYVPEMSVKRPDEFLEHIAAIRRDAITLLEECDKVSTSPELTRLKDKFRELTNFAEFLFVLQNPERIEDFHAATT